MPYQTNCGLGDDTPKGFTFKPTSFAGECQCGEGGCFGEFGEFIPLPLCENCGKGFASPIHGLCEKCAEESADMQWYSTQAWINESY